MKTYAITVRGRLSERFATAFDRARVETLPGPETRLLTEPFDQTQLRGLLNRVADLGLELVRVEETGSCSG